MQLTSLFKSGFWISFSSFAQRILALLSNLVLARLLLPSDFGVISIAYIFWSFFTLFTQESVGKFIVYKGTEDKRYLDTTYAVGILTGTTVAIALIACSPLIAKFFNEPALTWLLFPYAINLILSSAYYVYVGIMNRQMQYRELANINLIASTVRLIATIGSATLGLGFWAFAIGDTCNWLVGYVLTRYQSGHRLRFRIVPEVRSEVVSYSLGVAGSSLGYYTNANMDNFVVGKFLGSTNLGFYNLAYQLTMAISAVLTSVNLQLGMTVFAKLESDREQEKALLEVVEQTAFLTIPIYSLFFLVINEQVIRFVFGEQWTSLCSVIPGLLVFAYFRVITSSLDAMLCAKGYSQINAKVNLQIAPIAVIAFIFGAINGGIVGVSIAVALVLGIGWTLYWWRVGCRTLNWQMTQFIAPCFLAIFIALLSSAVSYTLPLIFKPITFMILYTLSIKLLKPKQFDRYQSLLAKFIKINKHSNNN
jgi:O-antigen/teichoic acid export membrane protein